jgi:hypothetical protein
MPALLKAQSSCPNRSSTASAIRATSSTFATSTRRGKAFPVPELAAYRGGTVEVTAGHDDSCPCFGERDRSGPSDAAAGAGDQGKRFRKSEHPSGVETSRRPGRTPTESMSSIHPAPNPIRFAVRCALSMSARTHRQIRCLIERHHAGSHAKRSPIRLPTAGRATDRTAGAPATLAR